VPTRVVSLADKQRLLDALLKVPALHDEQQRNLYVTELEAHLGRLLDVPRHGDTRHDLWSLVSGCLAYSGGLRSFVRIIRALHGDSDALTELEERVADVERGSMVSDSDREILHRIVAEMALNQVVAAAGTVLGPAEEGPQPNWRDVSAVVRRLEELPVVEDGVPPLITFVDRLAHAVGGVKSLELHRWIEIVSGGLGIAQPALRQLCVESQRTHPDAGLPREPAGTDLSETSELDGFGPPAGRMTDLAEPLAPGSQHIQDELRQIWGGVPIRNPNFTGRVALLNDLSAALQDKATASVLPQTLHGLGGVGKTQLTLEYVYRYVDAYDLVWWIPAEQPSAVLAALAELGERLGLSASDDMAQTAAAVLSELAATPLRWLLVYDNADQPEDIVPLVPSAVGHDTKHVILTSRNQTWATLWDAIEVDVFKRDESIELLQKRGSGISVEDADILARTLGDLPLALEQAAAWQATTGMPVSEYVELFDSHVRELLSEGKPSSYPTTVAAFVGIAVERLRTEQPATAQLLELFSYFGPEPVSVSLLRAGREAAISEPLAHALREPIDMSRIIRELRRYGLAKVDPNGQRIQVHRLVQLVLREGLSAEGARRTLHNVQNLLASANPGDPDEHPNWAEHVEIGPHVRPANLLRAETPQARQVVLDHMRYLYVIGDYENSRRLAQDAVSMWRKEKGDRLGPNGELTLLAARHLANAMRSMGDSAPAAALTMDTFKRLQRHPALGPDHEYTLVMANQVARDHRISGNFRRALEVDEENLEKHRQVFGEGDHYTLRAKGNLAVNLRMLGDFQAAYDLDREVADEWRQTIGDNDARTMFCVSNVARDLYGLGMYSQALDLQNRTLPRYRDMLGARHSNVLLAARTYAMTLRKAGRLGEALSGAEENYRRLLSRFGGTHEYTLAAAVSYAHTLRAVGELDQARSLLEDAHDRYQTYFGRRHLLTLASATNLAIVLRAQEKWPEAYAMDEATLPVMTKVLGGEHPYTLCVANNLANDLAFARETAAARDLSQRTLDRSYRVRREDHLHTLACERNHALDLLAVGEVSAGQELLDHAIDTLSKTVGDDHPETRDALQRKRAECDIEPPTT